MTITLFWTSGYWNVWLQHYTIIFDLTMCSHGTLDDYNDDNFHNSAIIIVFHDNNNIMMRSYSNIFSIENGILDADWSILKISSTDQSVSSIRVWFCSHSTTSLVLFCSVLFCSVLFFSATGSAQRCVLIEIGILDRNREWPPLVQMNPLQSPQMNMEAPQWKM